jgi:hypothetical protein
MQDREVIISFLQRVHRRRCFNKHLRELAVVFSIWLVLPVVVKLLDLGFTLNDTTLYATLGLWLLVFPALIIRRVLPKPILAETAAAVDTRAGLHDQMRTAYWFLENPRDSPWVHAQIAKAATTAGQLHTDMLFPRVYPAALYGAAAMLLLFVSLTFLPVPGAGNWLDLPAQLLSNRAQTGIPDSSNVPLPPSVSRTAGERLESEAGAQGMIDQSVSFSRDPSGETRPDSLSAEDAQALELASGVSDSSAKTGDPSRNTLAQAPATMLLGAPTHLDVQLLRESLPRQPDPRSEPLELKASRKDPSKLGYRYPSPNFGPAQAEPVHADQPPWAYRELIKDYFDAIGRPARDE